MNIMSTVNIMLGRLSYYVASISAISAITKGGVCPKLNTVYQSE